MELDPFQPTFLIQIENQSLAQDITQEITSLVFTDNEEELDVLELCITNRHLQFVDDPLFQEGNTIVARFGYVGNLSPRKHAVIKDIDYYFPAHGDPTMRIKAYDQGCKLAGKDNQKVWQQPAPGIRYSDIAEQIARAHGLTPVVTPTVGYHLRVVQSNQSDAALLQALATKARDREGQGVSGYTFFVQDDELHFHPRALEQAPLLTLEYFTDSQGVLRTFQPSTQSQGAKGAGVETKTIGVDPRQKAVVSHQANNATTPERTTLGQQTYLVDGNSGEGRFEAQETGKIVPSYERSEGFHQEPLQEPAQDVAESRFKAAELQQVEATAITLGSPLLRAKTNLAIQGVGRKFSGVYYCHSVRHSIGASGYACELKLKKNALGKGAGDKSTPTAGKTNTQPAPATPEQEPPALVTVDAESGTVTEAAR